MAPMHFVSAKTGHTWAEGFQQEDFRHWYSSEEDRITAMADATVSAEGLSNMLLNMFLQDYIFLIE